LADGSGRRCLRPWPNGHSFTQCSFYKNGAYYLEQDCDIATFFAAYHKRHGELPTVRENEPVAGSWIGRQFPHCQGNDPQWREAHAYLAEIRPTAAA
jgi:hypothetical protein